MADQRLSVAILGCGSRGADTYGYWLTKKEDRFAIVSLCEKNAERLRLTRERFGVPAEACFTDETAFFAEKRADLLVIATQDADHVRHCLSALALGYHVLLEKPITKKREECEALLAAQKASGKQVLVCHVLRYAPAFLKAASLIDEGAIGRLVAIDATEQVAYWHQAHSFVRGNWRRDDETSPMILAKCCHDLDLLQFYAKAKCVSVSSVGDLTFFSPENAPDGATARCLDCPHVETCPYSAKRIYALSQNWPTNVITLARPVTEEAIETALREGPYGRCVFYCDNNVVDHQLTSMTFENGVKATLTMTAFTAHGGRIYYFRGTHGDLILDEDAGYVRLRPFGAEEQTWQIRDLGATGQGHGGGDSGLVDTLYDAVTQGANSQTALEASIESHLMGIAAEKSRLADGALTLVH